MQTIFHDLSKPNRDIKIITLADLHLGDPHCDRALINSITAQILADPDMFVILDGDLINNATTQSVSDTYSEALSPMDQLQIAVDTLGDIAAAGKILAVLPGNHEERTYRQDGIDISRLIARQLDVEDVYTPDSALLMIKCGMNKHKNEIVYTAYINHGSGGGRKLGSKLNRIVDYAGIVDADVYIVGHTHSPAVAKQNFYRPRTNKRSIEKVEKVFVNTASALNYGGYGDRGGFTPGSNSYPVITLSAKSRKITVNI